MDPTVIALIGTILGGVGLKVVEWWLSKNRVRIDDATTIREELRAANVALKAENVQLEKDVDKWRDEYYKLYKDFVGVTTELRLLQGTIQNQLPRPPPE